MSIGRPVRGNGATNVLNRSSNAIHLPSGDRRVLRRVVAAHVHDLVAARQRRVAGRHADAEQRELLVAGLADEDARAGVVELRLGAAVAHEHRLAACGRHDVDAGVVAEVRPARLIAAGVPEHDRLAVRRKRRLGVVPGLRDDVAAAGCRRAG